MKPSRVLFPVMAMSCALLASGAVSAETSRHGYTRNVAVLLYEGVEVLDFGGPAEAFASAGLLGAQGKEPAFHVYTVAPTKNQLTSQGFLKVVPEYSIDDAPKPDIIVIPGGNIGVVLGDSTCMNWIAKTTRSSVLALTVCTGAMTLGKAGLLDGLDVTTWYNAIDALQQMAPKAHVHRGRRFIDNGHIVTTAGVSAGIDGSLHVIARLLGRRVADQTAQYMEYRWAPESNLVSTYSFFNPSLDDRGRSIQQADMFSQEKDWASAKKTLRLVVEEHPEDGAAWSKLGEALLHAKEYDASIDASLRASKDEDLRIRAFYTAACAAALKPDSDHAVEYMGKAIDAGLKSVAALSAPDFEAVRKDPRWSKLTARLQ